MKQIQLSKLGRTLALVGCALQLGLLGGMIASAISLVRAFGDNDNAEFLAHQMTVALYSAVAGLAFAAMGLAAIAVSLVKCRYRAGWFFMAVVAASVLLLTVFPIGTIGGGFLLAYVVRHRHEFGALLSGSPTSE